MVRNKDGRIKYVAAALYCGWFGLTDAARDTGVLNAENPHGTSIVIKL